VIFAFAWDLDLDAVRSLPKCTPLSANVGSC